MNKSKQALLAQENPTVTALMTVIIDEYGTEALQWDPETLKLELEDDGRVTLPAGTLDKISAGIVILTTDRFYTNLPDFIMICNAVANDEGLEGSFCIADAYDIVETFTEVQLLDPPQVDLAKAMDPEILGYIISVFRTQHVVYPPDCMSFIPRPELAIKDIGSIGDDPIFLDAGMQSVEANADDLQELSNRITTKIVNEICSLDLEHGSTEKIIKELERRQTENGSSEGVAGLH